MTLDQLRYLEQVLGQLICDHPDNIGYWLNIYRDVVEDVVTNENMGLTDGLDLQRSIGEYAAIFEMVCKEYQENWRGPEPALFYGKGE